MTTTQKRQCRLVTLPAALLLVLTGAPAVEAQAAANTIQPVRSTPTEKLTVDGGFRDWGPTTIAGNIIVAGSPSGKAGLHAVDMTTGKLRWSYRPTDINGSVSMAPAILGDKAIAAFGSANPGAVIAVSLATGKPVWRGPDPAVNAAVAVFDDMAYALSKDGAFYALNGANGQVVWKVALSSHGQGCASQPVVRDGVIYVTALADLAAGEIPKYSGNALVALDAKTGKEIWRYRAQQPDAYGAACLSQPVVTATTIYATGSSRVYAVNRATGRDQWKALEVKRESEGRDRLVDLVGVVDAGSVIVGVSSGYLIAIDKASGRTAWELSGEFYTSQRTVAVAGNVLYFQGSPKVQPAAVARGTLYALDLDTRKILWSFSRTTAEANWPFGTIRPVDGGVWVDSYKALVLLR